MTDVLDLVVGRDSDVPTLEHGAIIARLCRYLDSYVAGQDLGLVLAPQTTFAMVGTPPTRYPDLAFVRQERLPQSLDVDADFAPDLAVEVVSGSDTVRDVDGKVLQYLRSGVEMVWIIHPLVRTVEVHMQGRPSTLVTEGDELVGNPIVPGFSVPVRAIFVRGAGGAP